MRRIYESLVLKHFKSYDQMLFLVGARQVGKTTIAKNCQAHFNNSVYLNYDTIKDRSKILSGQDFIENIFPIEVLRSEKPLVIFDEIHKFKDWKNYLKGFYDKYKEHFHILVTGSTRLDVYKSGGDSLMGRYLQYRIHPLSVRELITPNLDKKNIITKPSKLKSQLWENLYKFGGFPNPFLQGDKSFFNRWQKLRNKQLFYEDIQAINQIQDIKQMELLAELLLFQSSQMINKSNLAKKIQVTVQTISRWFNTFESFYYCYFIKPWHKNITRSLIKEPKMYLWDWSRVESEGARFENFVASHLLKAVHLWEDLGIADFALYYLRNKDKREVDFLVAKNKKPWIIIETKLNSNERLSSNVLFFQKQIKAQHVLQVTFSNDYIDRSCFDFEKPIVVPAKTFLSQLV